MSTYFKTKQKRKHQQAEAERAAAGAEETVEGGNDGTTADNNVATVLSQQDGGATKSAEAQAATPNKRKKDATEPAPSEPEKDSDKAIEQDMAEGMEDTGDAPSKKKRKSRASLVRQE